MARASRLYPSSSFFFASFFSSSWRDSSDCVTRVKSCAERSTMGCGFFGMLTGSLRSALSIIRLASVEWRGALLFPRGDFFARDRVHIGQRHGARNDLRAPLPAAHDGRQQTLPAVLVGGSSPGREEASDE